MSPAGRLEGWRNGVLPLIQQKLTLDPKQEFENSAQAMDAAAVAFDEAMDKAKRYRESHSTEDPETQHAHMAHFFEEIGVLPLDAVRLVEEVLLD